MNVALRRPMGLDAFLEWERGQERRFEFDGVQPRAMTGGTVAVYAGLDLSDAGASL